MSRPSSLNMTLQLLKEHLTYDPNTGELRTRATRKVLHPCRSTKIAGVSVQPARAAYALGHNHIWDKVGFLDGDPSNLKLSNLFRSDKIHYTLPTEPRKTRDPDEINSRPLIAKTYPTESGKHRLSITVGGVRHTKTSDDRLELMTWKQRIAQQPDALPAYPLWANSLRRHFKYNPEYGLMVRLDTGKVMKLFGKRGELRQIPLPKFGLEPGMPGSLRVDRLAWLLSTDRLPDKETTRLAYDKDIRATSIQWNPQRIPRNDPVTRLKFENGRWSAWVYYNRKLRKVPGYFALEEEAETAALDTIGEMHMEWAGTLISLASFMAGGKDVYHVVNPPKLEVVLLPKPGVLEKLLKKPKPLWPENHPRPRPQYTAPEPTTSWRSMTGELRVAPPYTPIDIDLD